MGAFLLYGRSIKNLLIYSLYLPRIIMTLVNWKQYIQSYIRPYSGLIRFRNGLQAYVENSSDTSSISIIFFKREYGKVKDNSIILDVGANKGYFSMFAASFAKNVIIYAFEPVLENYTRLTEHIKLNHLESSIKPFRLGVAGAEGDRVFSITESISNSMVFNLTSEEVERIPCTTLKRIIDENELKKIDLIKMDCEGAEFEIFYGTPSNYLNRIAEIRMEYHYVDDKKQNILGLINFMTNRQFIVVKHAPTNDKLGIIWFKNTNIC